MYAKEGVGGILISDWFTDWFKGGGWGCVKYEFKRIT